MPLTVRLKHISKCIHRLYLVVNLRNNLLIACINRGGKILIPGGSDCIQAEDTVIVVTTHTGFHDIRDILK